MCNNPVVQVALGWVGDHPRVHATKTYALCLLVCGVATAVMPLLLFRHWLLAAACAAFGASFASTFSFTPTILAELVPMDRFTVAYGLNLLCQGVGNLLGPPFAGQYHSPGALSILTHYRPAMPFGKRKKYFRSFQFSSVAISKISPLWKTEI